MDNQAIIFNLKEAGRIGPRTMLALLDFFGTPQDIWEALPEELLAIPKIGKKTVARLVEARLLRDQTQLELEALEEQGVQIVTILDPRYPARLRDLGDAPSLLYVRGNLDIFAGPVIAVVGTHEANPAGIICAEKWGARLAKRGAVVVSGLARGIDAAAHVGTLQAGGTTVGVLGSGFARIYPAEHGELSTQVAESGAMISEYSPKTPVIVGRLMARNRIVVGLADAVLIVQVHESSSGTMDAATRAMEQGKPVFVVEQDHIPQLDQIKACGGLVVDEETGLDMVLNYL